MFCSYALVFCAARNFTLWYPDTWPIAVVSAGMFLGLAIRNMSLIRNTPETLSSNELRAIVENCKSRLVNPQLLEQWEAKHGRRIWE